MSSKIFYLRGSWSPLREQKCGNNFRNTFNIEQMQLQVIEHELLFSQFVMTSCFDSTEKLQSF